MQWRFVDARTVIEKYSGYSIHLLEGCWADPIEVRPVAPKGLQAYLQAELLRRGLEYAFDYSEQLKTKEEA